MVFIDVDSVFVNGEGDAITIETNRAMGNAILNLFSEGVIYFSAGEIVTPTEYQSELIEAGVANVTSALVA